MYHDRINLTIAALATSPGSSIGIIRISGALSHSIVKNLTGIKKISHMKASLVKVYEENGTVIERCLFLPFCAPLSFTGEDAAELHVHGSAANAKEILSMIFKQGATPALCGEFSFRAVLNGKMSLNESLSLNSLISASNPVSVRLSRRASFEDDLVEKLREHGRIWEKHHVLTTALIDFPDQVSDELNLEELKSNIAVLKNLLSEVIDNTLKYSKLLDFSVLIIGKPNVGKSTLFNALLKRKRAIISPTEGTTRDYISETLFIKGFPIKIIDSAGIRESSSEIEAEGIDKALELISNVDLTLVVLDPTSPLTANDHKILHETEKVSRFILYNKADLNLSSSDVIENTMFLSSKTGEGIEKVLELLENHIAFHMPDTNSSLFFSDWQTKIAQKIITDLNSVCILAENDQIELLSSLVKTLYLNIMNLSGEISHFDVYDKIFGSFCLGK
jgi:tRNA modification GTPase